MGGKYFIKRASQEILRERGSIEKAAKSFDEERSLAATIGGGREETNVDQDFQAHKHKHKLNILFILQRLQV